MRPWPSGLRHCAQIARYLNRAEEVRFDSRLMLRKTCHQLKDNWGRVISLVTVVLFTIIYPNKE